MKKMLMLIVMLIILSGCNNITQNDKTEDSNQTMPSISTDNTNQIKPIGDIGGNKDYFDEENTINLYKDLFNLSNKISFEIKIKDSELMKIENDYQKYPNTKCNIYRKVDELTITINNEKYTLTDVGIRMKGNTTRHSFVNSKAELNSFSHFMLSFQETFDDENDYTSTERMVWNDSTLRENRKNRTFMGLKGIELKFNAEADLTYARDIYAANVYRANGIYAQNTTVGLMNFKVMNERSIKYQGSLGLYKIYEPIDRVFIKRYFADTMNDGDLYKATWGSFRGMPDLNHKSEGVFGIDESSWSEQKSVSYDLKTNKLKSNHEGMRKLLNWINSDSPNLNNTLSYYMDEDYFITLVAMMYLTGDWDNLLYDSNNYYLYFNNLNSKCIIIPYDMDKTFGIAAKMNNYNMQTIKPLNTMNHQGDDNRSRLFKKTIDIKDSNLQKAYLRKIDELCQSVLNYDAFETIYANIEKNYSRDIKPTLITLPSSFNNVEEKYFYHLIYALEAGAYLSIDKAYGTSISVQKYFDEKLNTIQNS